MKSAALAVAILTVAGCRATVDPRCDWIRDEVPEIAWSPYTERCAVPGSDSWFDGPGSPFPHMDGTPRTKEVVQ